MQGLHAVGQGDHEPMDHGFGGGRAGRQVGSEVVQGRHLQPGFGSGYWQNSDPGLCSSNEGRFSKFHRMDILDNFESPPFFIFPL